MQQPDFLTVAATITRSYAQRLATETHWTRTDAPIDGRHNTQQAACGSYVDRSRFSGEPTCPACRQQLAIFESLEF